MSILPELSDQDKAILNSIFNPSLPLGEGVFENEFQTNDKDCEESDASDNSQVRELEILAIKKAEAKNYEEAINLFSECVKLLPNRAETFNNRAQVYQLQGNIEDSLKDLTRSIELSKGKGKTSSQALCQRGIIYRKEGKEEEARIDFQEAAKLGNAFAKQQMIEMNPYAALCNQMLSQVMQNLSK